MKKIILFIFFLSAFSCNSHKSIIQKQRESWGYKNWKSDFKDRALCKCLLYGYEEKQVVKSIYRIDKSYYDAIAVTLFDSIIDNVLKDEIEKMKSDSLKSISSVSEVAAGKTVFFHCIQFYKSKKLNSIVRIESEKWKKIKNIDTLVYKAMPSY